MANKSTNALGKSKKNYLNPIKNPSELYTVHLEQSFGIKYPWDLNIGTIFHIPTKGAIEKYGKEKLHVCIQTNVSEPAPDHTGWGKRRYTVGTSVLIPYIDFEKAKGTIPTFNQTPKPTNWN